MRFGLTIPIILKMLSRTRQQKQKVTKDSLYQTQNAADFFLAAFLSLDHIVYLSLVGLVRRISPEMKNRITWLSFLAWFLNVLLEIRCHFKAYHDAHSEFKDEQRARMLELALDANS